MRQIAKIALVVAAACSVCGCKSPTAPPPMAIGTRERIHTDGPVVLDESLQRETMLGLGHEVKVVLEDHGQSRTSTGTHQVWVRLRNVTDYDQYLQGRAHFLGANGDEVEEPSPWRRVFLPAKSIETYRAASMQRDEVKRFYIELRAGR